MFTLPAADELLARLIVVLLGIPIHEWAHGFAAHLMGDTTPEREGRLTLNPMTHLDPFGTLMILLTGFGWGRPARVSPHLMYKVRNPRLAMALSALAGPLSNFIQAVFFTAILRLGVLNLLPEQVAAWLFKVILLVIIVNVGLIAFNLLPIPPLDGSRILAGIAPPAVADFIERLEPISIYILLAVLFILPRIGLDLVSAMVRPLYSLLFGLLGLW
ncbi:MAG TPA: site-2 protease family protein [Anaerolineae bacterium]|nr:site-2 protease family protein [Anaerolineae bacterium]HRT30992.1 site-2 protease family protein [Anaerolineae bacterium]HXK43784.1 site-2 protease family protein [Anaerolineae bacterium]